MKTGKITAKLRDAVPVCLMVNGEEVKRYKDIELPEIFPEARTRVSRTAKAAAKAAAQESTEVMAVEAAEPEIEAAPKKLRQ